MRIVVLHNDVTAEAPKDQLDTLFQAEEIAGALTQLGHEVETLSLSLDLQDAARFIEHVQPAMVFNLVEGVHGVNRLHFLAAALLEAIGVPFTGNTADALFLTTDKIYTKDILLAHGIPTPRYRSARSTCRSADPADSALFLFKPACEDASVGIHEDSLCFMKGSEDIESELRRRGKETGIEWFAEEYIDGREFNISALGSRDEAQILPPAEIVFTNYPSDKPKVVGFKAKWDATSFELLNTPRRFDFEPADRPLIEEVRRLTMQCWSVFNLSGYARVDFRVDKSGKPFVLEVNANPCIASDSGFVAAAGRLGLDYKETINAVISHPIRPLYGSSTKKS